MVHDCRECGLYCDCDMEDTHLDAPADCRHECEPEEAYLDRLDPAPAVARGVLELLADDTRCSCGVGAFRREPHAATCPLAPRWLGEPALAIDDDPSGGCGL